MRHDGRQPDELRPITFQRDFTVAAAGSVLVSFGGTRVLCTASIDEDVPRWMRGKGKGWVTAEYSMLPGASTERIRREVKDGKPSGRTQEIQRWTPLPGVRRPRPVSARMARTSNAVSSAELTSTTSRPITSPMVRARNG